MVRDETPRLVAASVVIDGVIVCRRSPEGPYRAELLVAELAMAATAGHRDSCWPALQTSNRRRADMRGSLTVDVMFANALFDL